MANAEGELEFLGLTGPGTETRGIQGADIASAAGLIASPTHLLHRITGTAAVTLIPLPYPEFAGRISILPTGAFTGATGGTPTAVNKPIGLAFTAVVGKILDLTYYPAQGLWYPSYVA